MLVFKDCCESTAWHSMFLYALEQGSTEAVAMAAADDYILNIYRPRQPVPVVVVGQELQISFLNATTLTIQDVEKMYLTNGHVLTVTYMDGSSSVFADVEEAHLE